MSQNELATIEVGAGSEITQYGIEAMVQQLVLLEELVAAVLRPGQDYGTVSGIERPFLWKPGAATILSTMGCHAEPVQTKAIIDKDAGLVLYEYDALVKRNGSDLVVAHGVGACTNQEVKYRYRDAKPACPLCHATAINKSKFKPEFYCWARQGGCGATFPMDEDGITSQSTGRVENPDPLDQTNTIMKMALKRAVVDACLQLPGVARYFSQDMEDLTGEPVSEDGGERAETPTQASKPRSRPTTTPGKKPATTSPYVSEGGGVVGGKTITTEQTLILMQLADDKLAHLSDQPRGLVMTFIKGTFNQPSPLGLDNAQLAVVTRWVENGGQTDTQQEPDEVPLFDDAQIMCPLGGEGPVPEEEGKAHKACTDAEAAAAE